MLEAFAVGFLIILYIYIAPFILKRTKVLWGLIMGLFARCSNVTAAKLEKQ